MLQYHFYAHATHNAIVSGK